MKRSIKEGHVVREHEGEILKKKGETLLGQHHVVLIEVGLVREKTPPRGRRGSLGLSRKRFKKKGLGGRCLKKKKKRHLGA